MSNEVLREYNKEIQPRIRELSKMKEDLKDFLESDDDVAKLKKSIKDAQEELALFMETNDDVKQMTDGIKDVSREIKEAIKAASKATKNTPHHWKPAHLKEYMFARAKDETDVVVKTIQKGTRFSALNEIID